MSALHLSQKIIGLFLALPAPEDDAEATFKMVHQTARFWDQAEADAAYAVVKDQTQATVVEIESRSRKQQPPAPI